MATIVKYKDGGRYVVLGFGYGMFESTRPGRFLGTMFPEETSGESSLLCVCDYKGRIGLLPPEDCTVVEVDGKTPELAVRG